MVRQAFLTQFEDRRYAPRPSSAAVEDAGVQPPNREDCPKGAIGAVRRWPVCWSYLRTLYRRPPLVQ